MQQLRGGKGREKWPTNQWFSDFEQKLFVVPD